MAIDYTAEILSGLPVPAVLIGAQQTIRAINADAEKIFGAGMVGRHYITVMRQPVLLDGVALTLGKKRAQTMRYSVSEAKIETVFEVTSKPINGPDGAGALLTFVDVSAEEEAGAMRRDFVANVSHEMRTPLTAVLGFIETLRGSARHDSEARDRFLGIMEHEAARMNRLVDDLLSLSRVESEERIRPASRVDVVGTVDAAIQSLRPFAQNASVELVLEAPDEPLEAQADMDQLQQVFINLIENGIKYGGGGGVVTIRVREIDGDPALKGPGVLIDVIDQGEGIDPLHIPRLTERFYRIDGHRSREMGGTGLGLAIVKHIISRHRGRLRISSALGQGSRFTVLLPLSQN